MPLPKRDIDEMMRDAIHRLPTNVELFAVIKDQGRYDKRFGAICVCHVCGKHRQALIQCVCGAP